MSVARGIWFGAEELQDHLVPITKLRPFPGNARRGDVARIAESLRRFGQVRPVLVTPEDDGMLTIVAGHHVTQAAQQLGWDEIAVVTAEFESRADAAAYLVADNQLAQLGDFKPAEQATLLDEIATNGNFEGTGFTEEEYRDQKLLDQHRPTLTGIGDLQLHERQHHRHPKEQLDAMTSALKRHGMLRPVVVANDGTILAGTLVYEAAKSLGLGRIPVVRLRCGPEDPEALALMVADQALDQMGEVDDRQLVQTLTELAEDGKLDGTGYDMDKLSNLIHVTRPPARNKRVDEQREWEEKGMPGFKAFEKIALTITCDTAEEREQLAEQLGLHCRKGVVWSARWPPRPYEDPSSLFWDGREEEQGV